MNCRGQQQMVLFVIMEIVLVIIATTGMFALINRASTNYLPEKNYVSRDLALARDAIESTTNVYYEFYSPAMNYLTGSSAGFTNGAAQVDGFTSPILRNLFLTELPVFVPIDLVPLQVAAREFSNAAAVRKASKDNAVPCAAATLKPQTIALIPIAESSVPFTNLIASTDKRFIPSPEERKALITDSGLALVSSAKAELTVYVFVADIPAIKIYGSKDGYLGCNIVNKVLGTQKIDAAYVPSFEDRPTLTIGISNTLTNSATADAIRKVLS